MDYFLNLVAFGYGPKKKKTFILDTCICCYICIAYLLKLFSPLLEDGSD